MSSTQTSRPAALRALPAALIIALALTLGPAGSAHAVPRATYESDVITYTNAERVKAGRVKTPLSTCLDGYAEALSRALVKEQRLRHSNLGVIMRACGLRTAGENVAVGYSSGKTVVQGWMNSPGHRANIMNGAFTRIGTGAYADGNGRVWAVQVFGRPN